MDDMLQLPPRESEPAARAETTSPASADAALRVREVWARVAAPDRDVDAVLAAALDGAHAGDDAVERFAARVQRRLADACMAGLPFESAIYDCAAEAVAEDEIAEAWVGLVILLDARRLRSLAMIGLAVCAGRLGRIQDALTLALGSRAGDLDHPRALLVAGHLERLRGDLRGARRYFAVASRLARHRSGHAAEFRMAQRLLLTLQMV